MSEKSVKEQLDFLINELIEGGLDHFKPWGIFGLGFLPGNGLLMFLFGSQVREELGQYRAMYNNQFRIVLDYAREAAEDEEDTEFEKYRDEILEWDAFYVNYDGEHDEKFADELMDWYKKVGDDLVPIVDSDEEGFWDSAVDVYDKDELMGKLDHALSYSDVLEKYKSGIDMRTPPIFFVLRFRYTGEIIRTLGESEKDLIEKMRERANEEFGESS